MTRFWMPPDSMSWFDQVGLAGFATLPWLRWEECHDSSIQWQIVKQNAGHVSDKFEVTVQDLSRIFKLPLVPDQEKLPKVGTTDMRTVFGEPDASRKNYSVAKHSVPLTIKRYKWFLTFVCLKCKPEYISREHYRVMHAAELGFKVCWASFFHDNYFHVVNDKRRRPSVERMRLYLAALFEGMGVVSVLPSKRKSQSLMSPSLQNADLESSVAGLGKKKGKKAQNDDDDDDDDDDEEEEEDDDEAEVDDDDDDDHEEEEEQTSVNATTPITAAAQGITPSTKGRKRPGSATQQRASAKRVKESPAGENQLQGRTVENGVHESNGTPSSPPYTQVQSPVAGRDVPWLSENPEEGNGTSGKNLNAHILHSKINNDKRQQLILDLQNKSPIGSTPIQTATLNIHSAYEALQKHVNELQEKTDKFQQFDSWTVQMLLQNISTLTQTGFLLLVQDIKQAAESMFEASNQLSLTSQSLINEAAHREKESRAFYQNYYEKKAHWSDKHWATVSDSLLTTIERARREHATQMPLPLEAEADIPNMAEVEALRRKVREQDAYIHALNIRLKNKEGDAVVLTSNGNQEEEISI